MKQYGWSAATSTRHHSTKIHVLWSWEKKGHQRVTWRIKKACLEQRTPEFSQKRCVVI